MPSIITPSMRDGDPFEATVLEGEARGDNKCRVSLRETDFTGKLFASGSQRGVAATNRSGDRAPSYRGAAHQHLLL